MRGFLVSDIMPEGNHPNDFRNLLESKLTKD